MGTCGAMVDSCAVGNRSPNWASAQRMALRALQAGPLCLPIAHSRVAVDAVAIEPLPLHVARTVLLVRDAE